MRMRAAPLDEESFPPLGKTLEFMRVLWAVDHGLQATSKRMEVTLKVTAAQRLTLRIIGLLPDASAGELAQVLHLHPSTLTGILRRVEARGLVSRHQDPGDGRRSLFRLTEKGRAIDGVRVGTVEAAVRRALAAAPARQLAGAEALLKALARELEKGAGKTRDSA